MHKKIIFLMASYLFFTSPSSFALSYEVTKIIPLSSLNVNRPKDAIRKTYGYSQKLFFLRKEDGIFNIIECMHTPPDIKGRKGMLRLESGDLRPLWELRIDRKEAFLKANQYIKNENTKKLEKIISETKCLTIKKINNYSEITKKIMKRDEIKRLITNNMNRS